MSNRTLTIGLLLVVALGVGCNGQPAATITVTEAKAQTWTSDRDGKEYLVVAPTWRNDGPGEVSEVWASAKLTGPNGNFEVPEPEKPLYSADELPEGAIFNPTNFPDDVLIAGPADEVLAVTGPDPKAEVSAYGRASRTSRDAPGPDSVP